MKWDRETKGDMSACPDIEEILSGQDCPGHAIYLSGTTPDGLEWSFRQCSRGDTLYLERDGECLAEIDPETVGGLDERLLGVVGDEPDWDVVAWELPAALAYSREKLS